MNSIAIEERLHPVQSAGNHVSSFSSSPCGGYGNDIVFLLTDISHMDAHDHHGPVIEHCRDTH